jgi:hypothetical protein
MQDVLMGTARDKWASRGCNYAARILECSQPSVKVRICWLKATNIRLVMYTAHIGTRDLCSFKYSGVLTMQLRPLTLDGK